MKYMTVIPAFAQGCPGKIARHVNLSTACKTQPPIVLRGLVPRIHVFVWGARRRGWPGQAWPSAAKPGQDAIRWADPFPIAAERLSPATPARKRETGAAG